MIHPTLGLFLALYLAHLLSDFVFQTEGLLVGKRRGDWRAYALHGATHYLSACAVIDRRLVDRAEGKPSEVVHTDTAQPPVLLEIQPFIWVFLRDNHGEAVVL